MWIITNKAIQINSPNVLKYAALSYTFYTDEKDFQFLNTTGHTWFYKGYIYPRATDTSFAKDLSAQRLLDALYDKYKNDFINHLKGNFIIVHLEKDTFHIYTDRFAIKKYFYWIKDNEFIVSDEITEIMRHTQAQPSAECIAKYALTYHFTGGSTLYDHIVHNQPAESIELRNNKIQRKFYWYPTQLLEFKKRELDIVEISESLGNAIDKSLSNIDSTQLSLSLTGGADTRNLLALFLKKGIKPHLYTYGNPKSTDCEKASIIAKNLNLKHTIHDIRMDADTFERFARKILKLSGGLASIHRAHRLLAVELEKEFAGWMFLGTLGGEFIKGVSEDDYIVPLIVYDNWSNDNLTEAQLDKYLKIKFITPKNIDKISLLSNIREEPFFKGTVIERKLNALSYITAHLHDAQDINLYRTVMHEVFTPFLDIDYLELVFSSYFTFDQKEKINNKYIKRFNNPVYGSEFINATYRPLTKFLYSGDHKPSEVLFNKYYAALTKIIRQKMRGSYLPNFPLSAWMEEFVEKHLPICGEYSILRETFDLDGLMSELKNKNHSPKEAYWLKYTNPIMMRFIIEECQS